MKFLLYQISQQRIYKVIKTIFGWQYFIHMCVTDSPTNTIQSKMDISLRSNEEVGSSCLLILQQVLKNTSITWISIYQKEAAIAIAQHKTDVMALLRTGGGKSMLAIIPAIMLPHEAIIVVLPLRSLLMDWEYKLMELKVDYQVFNPSLNLGQLNPQINLILVSADKAKFLTWHSAIADFHEITPVTCLVFDEAHLVLLSHNFWDSLKHVFKLRELAVQVILLTATLPPSKELSIKEAFALVPKIQIFQQSSNRPELEYILEQPMGTPAMMPKIVHLVQQEQKSWNTQDRA